MPTLADLFVVDADVHVHEDPAQLAEYADAPWDVALGIRQRAAMLPGPAEGVLRAAAVAGRMAERALLMAIAGMAQEEALDALDAACRARLLEEDGPTAYRFPHDIVPTAQRDNARDPLSAVPRLAPPAGVSRAACVCLPSIPRSTTARSGLLPMTAPRCSSRRVLGGATPSGCLR